MKNNIKTEIQKIVNSANQKVVIANWKMNKKFNDIKDFCNTFNKLTGNDKVLKLSNTLVGVAPTMLGLLPTTGLIKNNVVTVCQHVHYEKSGAITGQVSYDMVKEYKINHVIIGHSETRQMLNVTDEQINKTILTLLANDMVPVYCLGESINDYNKNKSDAVITKQLKADLANVDSNQILKVIIAYEPIWAIGSGKSATNDFIAKMMKHIRNVLSEMYGKEVAAKVRVLYGGSVKPANAKEILAIKGVDGALVGGAGLNPVDFYNIVISNPTYLKIKELKVK